MNACDLRSLLEDVSDGNAGVSVVNIDNGFGAGYLANVVNRMACGAVEDGDPGDSPPEPFTEGET